ncbi:uncharacterized protein LOC111265262 [Varroa jacobsoni]|uniref:uncharacterized protein LOC111265262 n=1 Tax=Varroa jacobsoni TaxID=62625 RepID=UPI000BF5302B|nr:uncharacterized protein LOC111265262 [Varroa jacobsoni]
MIGRASTPAVSPYLDAFNMVSGGSTKRSSSSTSVRSAKPRSAPGTPKPGTPSTPRRARTPGGSQESGTVFTLEFNGGLRGASYGMMIKQQPAGGRNPVIVFTGSVSNNDKFSFTSKRTPGQNFNAVIYIDGLRYHQLSGCCENRFLFLIYIYGLVSSNWGKPWQTVCHSAFIRYS